MAKLRNNVLKSSIKTLLNQKKVRKLKFLQFYQCLRHILGIEVMV